MGLFDRYRSAGRPSAGASAGAPGVYLHGGDEDLEVVGESYRQDRLWAACGGTPGGERVRHEVIAVLVPEPQNPVDPYAIAVHIGDGLVGYVPRDLAPEYGPGLHALMAGCGGYVALNAVIVGGGLREDGPGMLGVWLQHDPRAFGIAPPDRRSWVGPPQRPAPLGGTMRTGFTEAWLTDVEDDSYDLSWFDDLPDADLPAIALLRQLLETDPDPIDRHFQFAELEARLYRCRDLFDSALDDFDSVCQRHDAEMETICQAFLRKWGKVPLLTTYKQMAIRRQKQSDWQSCRWWAERGLALYGDAAAREEAVEDLHKRRNRSLAKIEAPAKKTTRRTTVTSVTVAVFPDGDGDGEGDGREPAEAVRAPDLEVLSCRGCGRSFERVKVPGRKPSLCPVCRLGTA